MGKPERPVHSAMMEAFFATLQEKVLDARRWQTRHELLSALFTYLEITCNRERRHSSLNYRTRKLSTHKHVLSCPTSTDTGQLPPSHERNSTVNAQTVPTPNNNTQTTQPTSEGSSVGGFKQGSPSRGNTVDLRLRVGGMVGCAACWLGEARLG